MTPPSASSVNCFFNSPKRSPLTFMNSVCVGVINICPTRSRKVRLFRVSSTQRAAAFSSTPEFFLSPCRGAARPTDRAATIRTKAVLFEGLI
jgi:hypothetical protein